MLLKDLELLDKMRLYFKLGIFFEIFRRVDVQLQEISLLDSLGTQYNIT